MAFQELYILKTAFGLYYFKAFYKANLRTRLGFAWGWLRFLGSLLSCTSCMPACRVVVSVGS